MERSIKTASNENLYKDLSKQVRNKINKARKCGIEVKEASLENKEELNIFFDFIKRKHDRSYKYYQKLLREFGNNAKIYFSVLNTEKYLIQSKENLEYEQRKNDFINYKLQEATRYSEMVDKIINQKMESDKIVANCQKHLVDATSLFSKYPKGIIVGGILTIEYEDEVSLIIEGFDKKYSEYDPNYLLKWLLIEKYNKEEKGSFNLNGIVGEFKTPNKYEGLNESKLGFGADAVEYIGEFDLIINKTIYSIYERRKLRKEKKGARF